MVDASSDSTSKKLGKSCSSARAVVHMSPRLQTSHSLRCLIKRACGDILESFSQYLYISSPHIVLFIPHVVQEASRSELSQPESNSLKFSDLAGEILKFDRVLRRFLPTGVASLPIQGGLLPSGVL